MPAPTVTLVVVADGARARFFENKGVGKGIEKAKLADMDGTRAPSRDIDADRPGRSWSGSGGGRHGMQPPTDAHEHAEAEFLREVAAAVEEDLTRGRHDRIVVVAAPRALGSLRTLYGSRTKAAIAGEVDKNIVDADMDAVARAIEHVLAV